MLGGYRFLFLNTEQKWSFRRLALMWDLLISGPVLSCVIGTPCTVVLSIAFRRPQCFCILKRFCILNHFWINQLVHIMYCRLCDTAFVFQKSLSTLPRIEWIDCILQSYMSFAYLVSLSFIVMNCKITTFFAYFVAIKYYEGKCKPENEGCHPVG